MSKLGRWVGGIILIGLGVILALNAMNITDINIFFPGWWTLFIIVPSVVGLVTEKDKIGSLVGVAIGVALMLACQEVWSFSVLWKLVVPVLLVVIGIGILAKTFSVEGKAKKTKKIKEGEIVEDDMVSHWGAFGGEKVSYAGKDFDGCKVGAIFGGMDLDLRKANIKDGSTVKVMSGFGGVKIMLPDDCQVEVESTSIFGGVGNNHKVEGKVKTTLKLEAVTFFGGVEIK